MLYLLFYTYGENMLERRAPHRAAHLEFAAEQHGEGALIMAGAYTDPLDGAVLVFRSKAAAEAFPAGDPYVSHGLVTNWWVREWNVVVGGEQAG